MTVAPIGEDDQGRSPVYAAGDALVERVLRTGLDGAGRWKGAQAIAAEVAAGSRDVEQAIERLIATHRRLVGVSGFATGFGGVVSMAVTVPADIVSFYAVSARMVGAIAHLRGYDVASEEVRSLVLVSLLGASGTAVLGEAGVQAGTKVATAALRRLPGQALTRINQKVGFRLITKFGQKGVLNLTKVVPILGGGIGAGVNVTSLNLIARYAKRNFPALSGQSAAPDHGP